MLNVVRWASRLGSIFVLGLVGLFVVAGGPPKPATPTEWLLTVLLALGCAGMGVAWWRERLGGVLAFTGMGGFYLYEWIASGNPARGWVVPVMVLVSAGFLVCGLLGARTSGGRPKDVSGGSVRSGRIGAI